MTHIESRYLDAMESAPPTAKVFVASMGVREREQVERMRKEALREISPERLRVLSEILAFEVLTSNPRNVAILYVLAKERGDLQATSEWLSRYAPEAYRLVRKDHHPRADDSDHSRRVHAEVEDMMYNAPRDSVRKLFIVMGVRGEELDNLMGEGPGHIEIVHIGRWE